MTTTAYEALAAKLVEVTAERDRAIGWAVAPEQQLARVGEVAGEWESWAERRSSPRIDAFRDAAEMVRAVLNPKADR